MKHFLLILLVGYLGLYNGQLALFGRDRSAPDAVLPYRAETFSTADRERLKNGIPFQSEADLNRLMEDFLS